MSQAIWKPCKMLWHAAQTNLFKVFLFVCLFVYMLLMLSCSSRPGKTLSGPDFQSTCITWSLEIFHIPRDILEHACVYILKVHSICFFISGIDNCSAAVPSLVVIIM